jgi:hypothetical protein
MRARHPGFSWALHIVGSLTVIAVALLSAAVISGSVVYVINDASEPPSETSHTAGKGAQPLSTQAMHQPAAGAVNAQGKPVRIVDPALPPPDTQTASGPSTNARAVDSPAAVTATTPTPAPTPTQSPEAASAAPPKAPAGVEQSQAAADVASHKEEAGTDSSRAEQPTQKAATRAEDKTSDDRNNAVAAHAASRYAAKKRASNTARSAMQEQAQSTARRRVYDYYSSDDRDGQNAAADFGNPAQPYVRDPRAQLGSSRTRARVIVRRQDDYYNDDNRGDERAAWRAQPRRSQSFFGFFGRDRSDNWQGDRD